MVDIHNPEEVDDPSLNQKGMPEGFMYQGEDGTFYEVQKDGSKYVATEFGDGTEADSINYDSVTQAESDINLDDAVEELSAKSDRTMAETLNR